MTLIRPAIAPQTPVSPARPDAARLAAQRAFFATALGQPAAIAAPAAVETPVAPVRPLELRPAANAEAPSRILRPGSLLDIRV